MLVFDALTAAGTIDQRPTLCPTLIQSSLIMMHYQEYYPSSKFRNIISCFWTVGFELNAKLPDLDVVLPDGCTDLLINTGPYFKRIDSRAKQEFKVRDYALIGQRKNAIEVAQTAETTFFAIRFTPFGMRSLFSIKASALTGEMLEDDNSIKSLADPIRLILEKKGPFLEKLQNIEVVLENRIAGSLTVNPLVERATREIIRARGNFNVTSFCRKNGIHKSTLEKNFLTYVGLSPKAFAAIIRFNHTHSLLRKERKLKLTHLALDCGYYDQSHMIKEFRRFSNNAPSKFLEKAYLLPNIAVSCHKSLRF